MWVLISTTVFTISCPGNNTQTQSTGRQYSYGIHYDPKLRSSLTHCTAALDRTKMFFFKFCWRLIFESCVRPTSLELKNRPCLCAWGNSDCCIGLLSVHPQCIFYTSLVFWGKTASFGGIGGLGAVPPAGSMGRSPGQGVMGQAPEAESFLFHK